MGRVFSSTGTWMPIGPLGVAILLSITGCTSASQARPASLPTKLDPRATPRHLDALETKAVDMVWGMHGPRRDAVYATFGDNFRSFLPIEKFHSMVGDIDKEAGKLVDVMYVEENSPNKSKGRGLRVVAAFTEGARLYTLWFDHESVLRGLSVEALGPNETSKTAVGPADNYVAKQAYRLPGHGVWSVGNGGRAKSKNHHVGNPQQWYAYDLIEKGPDGKSFTGDGKRVGDYLAFGQPVVAPRDGTVVAVVDGVPDNEIGETNGYVAPGNYLAIDHGDGEVSFLCHFEKGSFVVTPGAKVRTGDLLGKVGNSGNTSEPHIHWHLATDTHFEKGHGLPIRFERSLWNGLANDAPDPVQGDTIETLP